MSVVWGGTRGEPGTPLAPFLWTRVRPGADHRSCLTIRAWNAKELPANAPAWCFLPTTVHLTFSKSLLQLYPEGTVTHTNSLLVGRTHPHSITVFINELGDLITFLCRYHDRSKQGFVGKPWLTHKKPPNWKYILFQWHPNYWCLLHFNEVIGSELLLACTWCVGLCGQASAVGLSHIADVC